MSEHASRLEAIRERLVQLEAGLVEANQGEFAERVGSLAEELRVVIAGLGGAAVPATKKARRKLPDVEKCPRCAIRSLHIIPDEVRQAADGTDQVLWRCSSCGHEIWQQDR